MKLELLLGTLKIKTFFNDKVFNNPKPEELLQKIIELSTPKSDPVFDYHLNIGTTCAVAHKMGKQYIDELIFITDKNINQSL